MPFSIFFVKLYNVLRNKFDYKAIIGKKRKQEKNLTNLSERKVDGKKFKWHVISKKIYSTSEDKILFDF